MILQSLDALYDRLALDDGYMISPPGYSVQKIAFKVVLRPTGELLEIQDARQIVDGTPRPRLVKVPGSAKPSGSGIHPCLLWDNTGYMLGFKRDDDNPERTRRTFDAFRQKHVGLEASIESAGLSAVCRFLERWKPEEAADHPILGELDSGFGVFQLQGHSSFIHEDPEIEVWWDSQGGQSAAGIDGQCLVTGQTGRIAKTHPSIKGVKGSQSSGAALVSFNEASYESYGKRQSFNSPVSDLASFRYSTALNALLGSPMSSKHRLSVGDSTALFWTEKPTPTEDIFARFATGGSRSVDMDGAQDELTRQKLEAFLRAMREGREAYGELEEDPDSTPFYILGLAPNAARLSIRFFHRGTLSDLLANLRRHYRDIQTDPQPASGKRKADPEFPAIWMLLRQTARESKEIPPVLAGPLVRAVVTGAPYPNGLYQAVIRRIHADRDINYLRACVIKGHLKRNLRQEVPVSLDLKRQEPSYRLGRLFAALEKTQGDALGPVNASIRQRFYSSASATPQSVFPRLLRTYQHHLGKLEGGRKVNREKLIQEILDPLETFPAHLGLEGQGLFALGYYHQTRALYTKKSD